MSAGLKSMEMYNNGGRVGREETDTCHMTGSPFLVCQKKTVDLNIRERERNCHLILIMNFIFSPSFIPEGAIILMC